MCATNIVFGCIRQREVSDQFQGWSEAWKKGGFNLRQSAPKEAQMKYSETPSSTWLQLTEGRVKGVDENFIRA